MPNVNLEPPHTCTHTLGSALSMHVLAPPLDKHQYKQACATHTHSFLKSVGSRGEEKRWISSQNTSHTAQAKAGAVAGAVERNPRSSIWLE